MPSEMKMQNEKTNSKRHNSAKHQQHLQLQRKSKYEEEATTIQIIPLHSLFCVCARAHVCVYSIACVNRSVSHATLTCKQQFYRSLCSSTIALEHDIDARIHNHGILQYRVRKRTSRFTTTTRTFQHEFEIKCCVWCVKLVVIHCYRTHRWLVGQTDFNSFHQKGWGKRDEESVVNRMGRDNRTTDRTIE